MEPPANNESGAEPTPSSEDQSQTKPAVRAAVPAASEVSGPMRAYARRLTKVAAPQGHIGKRTVADLETLHLADALIGSPPFAAMPAHPAFELPEATDKPLRLVDIGSGAGLPGIPLAIARPDLRVFLVESRVRAAGFLQDTVDALGLANIRVLRVRAETLAHDPEFRESFHLATARALAATGVALELCLPLLRVDGRVLLYKTAAARDEIAAAAPIAARLGGAPGPIHTYELPGLDQPRVIATFEKTAPSPAKYPRRSGTPSRCPLKP